jgi:hypothetical protein
MSRYPTDEDNRQSVESDPTPSSNTHHYHGPVTIHLYGLASVHVHRHSDDTTPLNSMTTNSDSATTNTYKIRRKPLSASPNGRPPEDATNASLNPNTLLSSTPLLKGGETQQPQQAGVRDWNGPNDLDNPETRSLRKKVYHTFVPSAIAFLT